MCQCTLAYGFGARPEGSLLEMEAYLPDWNERSKWPFLAGNGYFQTRRVRGRVSLVRTIVRLKICRLEMV